MPARLSLKDAQQAARKFGGKCLSKSYTNAATKMKWECKKGHTWNIRLNSVKHMGQWCPFCARAKETLRRRAVHRPQQIKIISHLVLSKGGSWTPSEYTRNDKKVSFSCARGHEWKAVPRDVIHLGNWCPECGGGTGERLVRVALEHLVGQPFPKCRPAWLKSLGGRPMELDGYCENLGLAFEHQGLQHYSVNFFTKTKSQLRLRIAADRHKLRLCEERGIKLLVVPQVGSKDLPEAMLEPFLREELKKALPRIAINSEAVNYLPAYELGVGGLDISVLQKAAERNGGQCLDEVYKGQGNNYYRFRCSVGHTWKALARSVLHSGSWCPKCRYVYQARKLTKPTDELDAHAKRLGGSLITRENVLRSSKAEWECASGHRWWATPNQVLSQKTWCPVCARESMGNSKDKRLAGLKRMQGLAISRGGKCISSEYVNIRTKMRWRCRKGHEWLAKPNSVVEGQWCPRCWKIRLRAGDHLSARKPS